MCSNRHDKDCEAIDDHHVTDGITFKSCTCIIGKVHLSKEEARALVKELDQTFISRDNELCKEVLDKLERFVNDN